MPPSFPQQPEGPPAPPEGTPAPPGAEPAGEPAASALRFGVAERLPAPPAASEATRMLCVGVYQDRGFREDVFDELYVHEERFPAPSVGFDAGRVLSHAVRARRSEVGWAGGILAAWVIGVAVGGPLFFLFMLSSLLLNAARLLRGTATRAPMARRVLAFLVRWYARGALAGVVLTVLAGAFGGSDAEPGAPDGFPGDQDDPNSALPAFVDTLGGPLVPGFGLQRPWAVLLLFLMALMAVLVGLRRGQFARVVSNELAPGRFPDAQGDPAETLYTPRLDWLRARLRAEQHRPLVMYDAVRPFCGFGLPFGTWSLAVELRPREGVEPTVMDNAGILRRIVPFLEGLRRPSAHGTARTADAVLDRLRELEIDECVFLPAYGIRHRDAAPYGPPSFAEHRDAAVEEGGEARRHFLRVRVGGWEEEVVVTVFVRAHTQGGMLMLEFAPHLLTPVRAEYRVAERQARRHLNNSWAGKAAWAVVHTPASLGQSVRTLGWWVAGGVRRGLAGNAGAPPEGPAVAVRELAAESELSLFQEMDVSRYLKTVQDRVAGGVRVALHEAGWETDEFEQKIVNVSGGVYIESVRDSAVGVGDHNTVNKQRGPAGSSRPAPGAGPKGPTPGRATGTKPGAATTPGPGA